MPITADQVRELAAKGEGTILDFKREQYDWNKPAINAELTKDLMAIANELRLGGPAGFILIGVDIDGTIVGVPIGAHIDDADVHRRVENLLNRTPIFSYSSVDVGGISVGVFHIEPGGRPFFPVRDSGTALRRRVPLHRNGTTTDVASPLHVLDWAKEDDPYGARLRELELEVHQAERALHATVQTVDFRTGGNFDETSVTVIVRNHGRRLITLAAMRWRIEWLPEFFRVVTLNLGTRNPLKSEPPSHDYWRRGEQPPDYEPPSGGQALSINGRPATIPPGIGIGQGGSIPFHWTHVEASEHFDANLIPASYVNEDWLCIHFEIDVVGEFGATEVLHCVAP